MNLEIKDMTNSELKLQIKKYEDEYESIKNKVRHHIDRLNELDRLYNMVKNELTKRKSF